MNDDLQNFRDALVHFRNANMTTLFQKSKLPVSKARLVECEVFSFRLALYDILSNWDHLVLSSPPQLQQLQSIFHSFLGVFNESDNYKTVLRQIKLLTKVSKLIVSFLPEESSSEEESNPDDFFNEQDDTFSESFSMNLTKRGKSEVESLKKYLGKMGKTAKRYEPSFVPIIQSSGYGKTKICFELLRDCPGIPLVFRNPTQNGYPSSSEWVQNFYEYIFESSPITAKDGLPSVSNFSRKQASLYTPTRFLIALNILLDAYFKWFNRIKKENDEDSTRTVAMIGDQFLRYPSHWGDTENRSLSFKYTGNITIKEIIDEIKRKMVSFLRNNRTSIDCIEQPNKKRVKYAIPFIFVLDELTEVDSLVKPGHSSAVNVIRRGLHILEAYSCNIVALAISTNKDVIGFTPPTNAPDNSQRKRLHPPLIIFKNFDIFSDDAMLRTMEPSHTDLLNPKLMNLLIAMGRPLWCSVPLHGVVSLAEMKIRNGSFPSGEHILACWLIRCTNLSINPFHPVAQTLMNSHMATVYNISSDGISMKINYPSEPSLALGARAILSDSSDKMNIRHDAFKILLKFIEQRAVDNGRLAEAIFEQIVLYAMDDSSTAKLSTDSEIVHNETIRRICNASDFILEVQRKDDDAPEHQQLPADVGEDQFKSYHVVQIETFLVSLFGVRISEVLKIIPANTLEGLVNLSHFVTISRDKKNVSSSRGVPFQLIQGANNFTPGCNLIDRALLKLGLTRQCGFVMPVNYFGFDFFIPYVKKEKDVAGCRPLYSFIPCRVEAGDTSIHDAVVKMALQFHLCKCLAHATAADCSADTCPSWTSDSEFDNICRDQLAILFCAHMTFNFRTSTTEDVLFYVKSNDPKEISAATRTAHNLFGRSVRAVRKPFPSFSDSLTLKRANKTPDVIFFKSLSKTLAIEIMKWGEYKLTCLISSQLNNFKHLIGSRSINVARRIIEYDDSDIFDNENPSNCL